MINAGRRAADYLLEIRFSRDKGLVFSYIQKKTPPEARYCNLASYMKAAALYFPSPQGLSPGLLLSSPQILGVLSEQ